MASNTAAPWIIWAWLMGKGARPATAAAKAASSACTVSKPFTSEVSTGFGVAWPPSGASGVGVNVMRSRPCPLISATPLDP